MIVCLLVVGNKVEDTATPSFKPTKKPHDDKLVRSNEGNHRTHLAKEEKLSRRKVLQAYAGGGSGKVNVQVTYLVAYVLQNTPYTSVSSLESALESTLHNAVDLTTDLLDAIKASNVLDLQSLSTSSLSSITSTTPISDTYGSNDDAYNGSERKKLIIGVAVGGGTVLLIAFGMYLFYTSSDDSVAYVLLGMSKLPIWIATATAAAAIGLVAAWARNNHGDQTGILVLER